MAIVVMVTNSDTGMLTAHGCSEIWNTAINRRCWFVAQISAVAVAPSIARRASGKRTGIMIETEARGMIQSSSRSQVNEDRGLRLENRFWIKARSKIESSRSARASVRRCSFGEQNHCDVCNALSLSLFSERGGRGVLLELRVGFEVAVWNCQSELEGLSTQAPSRSIARHTWAPNQLHCAAWSLCLTSHFGHHRPKPKEGPSASHGPRRLELAA